MKVKISNYRDRWISKVHDRHMDKKYGKYDWEDNKDWKDNTWERVEAALQWIYNHSINLILDKRSSQKISVHIDYWDTWSMDHTLSYIILPMLKQLKATKHGSPHVDDEDVPEELKSTSAPSKENEYDTDDNWHKRWEWVLDEMIWAFEQKARDGGWESDYYEFEDDPNEMFGIKMTWSDDEGREAHQKRMSNGFRLFGKYYEALWD